MEDSATRTPFLERLGRSVSLVAAVGAGTVVAYEALAQDTFTEYSTETPALFVLAGISAIVAGTLDKRRES